METFKDKSYTKDLKKELTREKEGGKNENKILKITLLEKELQILKMKFDSLMKEHIPVAKHLLWPSMPHQEKDLVLKTQTALVKDVLEPLRDLCPIKDYGKCKAGEYVWPFSPCLGGGIYLR